jgi:gamma-glutamylcyclotransferase (GGCT)/AIG2-like uncharacterized protein YtfP
MSQDSRLYFAYGANLNRNHMALWCPESEPLQPATLHDYRIVFRFWCDILPTPGRIIPGALYRLGKGDLKWLDEYEDCPRLYEHVTVTVDTHDGRFIETMTYQMKAGHPFAPPEAEYLDIIRQGYADWNYNGDDLPG